MSLEDKVDRLATDFSEHRGEMKQFALNMTNWVQAVNIKVNDHVQDHAKALEERVKDIKTARKDWWNIIIAAGMLILTTVEVLHIYVKR